MLKELIAVGMASILLTQPPQNTNDGTYYQDVEITETYEYETNEVNSVDDLVVGNIYKFEMNNVYNSTLGSLNVIEFEKGYLPNVVVIENNNDSSNKNVSCALRLDNSRFNLYILPLEINGTTLYYGWNLTGNNIYIETCKFYFVYQNLTGTDLLTYISASDYLGEKTITIEPVETEGLYNLAYHFLYSRIYTNTELQGMETTLFGETINMNMWLSHTTAIVIICLLLIVLIKFVIWLFKIVSGGMLWK